jgi:alpha-amylase
MLSDKPYIFSRVFEKEGFRDMVVAGLDLDPGKKKIDLGGHFEDGTVLRDYYSGKQGTVQKGGITIDTPHDMVLLGL